MHIGFDNSSRLCRDVYYFEYKGIKFKLIQNNIRKWCDVLLTIIPGRDNEEAKNKAYITASEFLSALSWENNSRVIVHHPGGAGIREDYQLRQAKSCIFDLPRISCCGALTVGYDICRIPDIETEEQKNALAMFREASSSNNNYLSLLFFWQILDIGNGDPIGWIDKTYRKKRDKIKLSNDDFQRLPLNGKKLGNYFYDDCRNAIAHIFKHRAGKVRLKLDTPANNTRIEVSTWAIKEFARFYIIDKLKLRKHMYLVRRYGRYGKGFPVFVSEREQEKIPWPIAYKKLTLDQMRKKRWH